MWSEDHQICWRGTDGTEAWGGACSIAGGRAQTRQWSQTRPAIGVFVATYLLLQEEPVWAGWGETSQSHFRTYLMNCNSYWFYGFYSWGFLDVLRRCCRECSHGARSAPEPDGYLEGENCAVWVTRWTKPPFFFFFFFWKHHFYLKMNAESLSVWEKVTDKYLLPEFSSENFNFGRLVSATVSLVKS